eukprot:6437761-Prymnesium_polylepis.1
MEADHPAERLRVRVAARGIVACSSNVPAPRGRRRRMSAHRPALDPVLRYCVTERVTGYGLFGERSMRAL